MTVYPHTPRPSEADIELLRLESERHLAAKLKDWPRATALDRQIAAIRRRIHDEEFLRRTA